ncbi:MAG: hypothetical protein Q8O56_02330 [Solirubrobacteraceae bacterium]|nr:hypothetical protein [Solirubrobacteraceae bacterium]
MTLDEALLTLNDRLGQEITAWVEVAHESPLLIATGQLENWSHDKSSSLAEPAHHFDLRGHYSIGDARFDLSDAPVEMVSERTNGLTFRIEGGVRLVVTWPPAVEGDLV